ncbi:TetR/AcrR family transcriptional regulator [Labrenzia sp. PHM005]|uniref:TetR/AcrR family transcriptional regulator n=1 Tax=Labrenzia sp. PHM005 TaxID=2590016 RepID=UPI00113FC844|nr:TetR/AcrR family transcriptional regulator [Labrenzia sp. PHM005]QDG79075.1 TetR/AcrR family transcriptional regulator [Labrenzia sp. PHM005]
MARLKTGDKPADIRRAAVDVVVEVGSSAASINTIAKRAGLSVGTVYRYHDSKDAVLRSVFLEIKRDVHHLLMSAAEAQSTSQDKLRAMWFALLDFAHNHPQDFAFAEVILNTSVLLPEEDAIIQEMAQDIGQIIEAAITDGTLRPANVRAINAVLSAPALRLGRQTAMSGVAPDPDFAEEIFDLCWRGVAA